MSTKTTTTTTDASAEDRQRVQGIKDDDGGGRVLTTGPVDWQRQQSVGFSYFQVSNSNTVSSLSSRYLVLIFFSSYSFFSVHCMKYYQYCNNGGNVFVPSVY